MTTLADELLADLAGDDEEQQLLEDQQMAMNQPMSLDLKKKSLKDVALLWTSAQLKETMQKIRQISNNNNDEGEFMQEQISTREDEHQLVSRINATAFDIDDEIAAVFRFIKDLYHKSFPEMESLILDPLEYARTVQLLRNDINVKAYDSALRCILKPATVLVLTVSSTTTKSDSLSDSELEEVLQGCQCIIDLNNNRNAIVEFVQSRMSIIAPNLSAIIGPRTAAQLIGAAGGLLNLSRVPSCNLPMLGSTKTNLVGLSSANPENRNGYLYQSEFYLSIPPEFRKQAMRVMSGKLALTARVDACKEYPDGSMGRQFRQSIDEKLEKWQEPPPNREVKAIELPDEKRKSRRGGKRVRKMKEKQTITEMQKQANRVAFGVAEEEVMFFDETEGLGMLTGSGAGAAAGKIRAAVVDTRVKAKTQRAVKATAMGQKTTGLATSITRPTSGLSSLVFTPVQGMELVDPEAQKRKLKDINDKWFASTAKFQKVDNNSSSSKS